MIGVSRGVISDLRTKRTALANRMRHPVSTADGNDELSAAVKLGVIALSIDPGAANHAHPGACEDANGVRMFAAAVSGFGVDAGGPCTGVTRVVGQAGQSRAGDGCRPIGR